MRRGEIKVWRSSGLDAVELRRGRTVSAPYPRHWHEEYQFCLIEGGGGHVDYRGSRLETPTASFFVAHPGEVHSNEAYREAGCSFRSLYLSAGWVAQTMREILGGPQPLPFFSEAVTLDEAVVESFRRLHVATEGPESDLLRQDLLLDFFATLLRDRGRPASSPSRESESIRRLRELLDARAADNISLDDLAREAGLSPFHLHRLFRRQVGMPPHAYQLQARIARAKRLIRQGLPLASVAAETGFADQSHFTRHFRRLVLMPPGRYARQSKIVQDGPNGRPLRS